MSTFGGQAPVTGPAAIPPGARSASGETPSPGRARSFSSSTPSAFDPRASVEALGARSLHVVEQLAAATGGTWTPATLRAASEVMEAEHAPRLAKRLHLLAAIWAVNHRGVRA